MESTRLLFPFSPMDFLRGTMKFPFLYFRTFEDVTFEMEMRFI